MSRGRHQFFFRSLSNLYYPRELIHDAVCLSLCRTLHLKSDDWMLHVRVGKTCLCYRIDVYYHHSSMQLLIHSLLVMAIIHREVRVGQGELRGLLQIKVRGSCDQGADCCRRNKAPDPERPGGDEA